MDFDKYKCEVVGGQIDRAAKWLDENYPDRYCILCGTMKSTVLQAYLSTADRDNLHFDNVYTFGFADKETMVACKLKFG